MHKETSINTKPGDFLLALDYQEVEQRACSMGKQDSAADRLSKLFNIPKSSFPEGEDVYSCLAAHSLNIPISRVSKPQRNEVKSRIVEWLYYGKIIR